MKYNIIFCFTRADGRIETDEAGVEIYHREEVEANTKFGALRNFMRKNRFVKRPEIIEIIGE